MNQAYYALVTMRAFFSDRLDNRKDRGVTAVEYGLMVGLIAVVIIIAVAALGGTLDDLFTKVNNDIFNKTKTGAAVPTG